ncbi:MAG: hypothetical protein CL677_05175 [Bdellovibrionaceae bacterium]|nr:hypothetical protein [Pseudobdellovibrionaceae bacterium]|tara:strand:+ start:80929 stop:81501 length:573 start_codon:yes stop_codon:yes gene_type:complete
MKALLCLLSTLVFSLSSWSAPKAYYDVNDNFIFKDHRIVVDGKEVHLTLLGFSGLSEAMASDPIAKKYAEQYECYSTWAGGLVLGGAALAIAYSLLAQNDTDSSGDKVYNAETAWAIFGLGFIPGTIMGGRAGVKLTRAINQYNGVTASEKVPFKDDGTNIEEAEPETVEDSSKLYLIPTFNGFGLAYTF